MYYAARDRAPSAQVLSDAVLASELATLWEENYCVYGVGKLWKAARQAGLDIGRDQTGRLMRAAGVEGATSSKRVKTTRPDPTSAWHPDLVKREFTATAPNRLWATELTLVPTWAGIAYVCFIVDAFSRMIVGVAGRVPHAHRDGPRRDRDGPLVPRCTPRRSALSQRRGLSVHVDSLRRTPRGDRRDTLDRNRRRFV